MDTICCLNRLTFTAGTEGGKGSSRAFSANTRGNPSGVDPQSIATKYSNTRGWSSNSFWTPRDGHLILLFIGSGRRHLLVDPGLQRLLAGVHVINSLCLYQVTVVYNKGKPIHTSGLGVESASLAGTLQKSDSVAVCGIGAWASMIHAAAMVLAGESLQYVLAPGCPPLWELVHHGVIQQFQEGRRRCLAACLGERRGAAGRRFQASAFQLPLPLLWDQSKAA